MEKNDSTLEKNAESVEVKQVVKKSYINDENVVNKQYPICIASFPRSGNTMMRTIYENTTSTYTGDDMIIKYDDQSDLQLRYYDLGLHDNVKNTFLIKTHFPDFTFKPNEFKSQGAVLLVRNPFDAFDSYFEMTRTDSHHKKLSDEARKEPKNLKIFENFVNWLTPQYNEFHQFWIENLVKVPIKVLKYEWFTNNKEVGTREVFEFLFKFNADKAYFGNLTKEEILEKLEKDNIAHSTSYKPGTNASHNNSLEKGRYSQELLDKIVDVNYDVLNFFDFIDEYKKLHYEDLKLAILKKEKSLLESKKEPKSWGFKFDEIKEIQENLFKKFGEVENPLLRDHLVINDKLNDKIVNNYDECINFFDFDFEEFERKFGKVNIKS